MYIKKLELKNFRNYESLDIDFDKYTNILYGNNAQGKTNILESLYICSTTKSHKGNKDKEIIKFDEEESHIRIYLDKNGIEYKIDMHLRKNKSKYIAVNGVPLKKASEFIGLSNVVIFSPENLNIIKNGPSERRRFIDMELCQLDKLYVHNLSNYNKVLIQRNNHLKNNNTAGFNDILDILDEQLYKYGKEIILIREKFINDLNNIIKDIHYEISGGLENIVLKYEADVSIENFKEKLKNNRKRDIDYKLTSVGPHRDDIVFEVNDIDIRKYGSQGQQRTTALSLKLAEIEIVKNKIKESPILLLDDVLSELDSKRQNSLLNKIGNIQTIITCTGLDEFVNNRFNIDRVYRVEKGRVERYG